MNSVTIVDGLPRLGENLFCVTADNEPVLMVLFASKETIAVNKKIVAGRGTTAEQW